jgi:hypothetical protein
VSRLPQRCACNAFTGRPSGMPYYEPSANPEPGASVSALVRYGDMPSLCRWERTDTGLWTQHGTIIGLDHPPTPPLPWSRIATRCWAGTTHALLAIDQRHGDWTVVLPDSLPTPRTGT